MARNISVRDWKHLERHPLSATYPDIKGRAWRDFVENMREHGHQGRQIVLYEGKVLDGWQFQRACAELDIKPTYIGLPEGSDPLAFVETKNDHRRHESPDVQEKRAEERRQRVLAARQAGQSERTIAEEEGVSPATIHSDVETLTARGEQCSPDNGMVTGKDGRKQPATKSPVVQSAGKACRPCRMHGFTQANPACKGCESFNKPGEREPGDDTDHIAEEKKAKSANGKPVFDDRKIHAMIGKLIRLFDDRARAVGKCKEHTACVDAMSNVLKTWKEWQKK
jgi:hypothetical protein